MGRSCDLSGGRWLIRCRELEVDGRAANCKAYGDQEGS
jgi:hypothetical protein